ncbi:MAG: metallophosphoesterase [Gemmatimonadetes bacterium]|nr:metallophosphoesterase [Gemmatimonadota bacterium]
MKRRQFLRLTGAGAVGGLFYPGFARAAGPGEETVRLIILHTNDTHSRMDPFPMDGGRFEGLGGAARRATLIQRIRAENPNVLLLDSGDIFQGTPYFNFFKGEIEFKAMSAMEYDVATIGNHDFDNGVDGLVEMMPHASFQFVSANYDVTGSPLEPYVLPWLVKSVGGVKVGIFGLGIAFDGLVLSSLHAGVRHTDPYAAARRAVSELRRQGCSLVVCLSHLGYRYRDGLPSDTLLAQEVEGIDIILGGHTHTFMDSPDVYPQPGGRQTVVNQVGWSGMRLGRIDVLLGPPKPGIALQEAAVLPKAWGWNSYTVDASLD